MSSVGLADHYGVLEVERDADEGTVKRAYRKLVLQWHPDKHQESREVAEEQIRRVNDAYETLGNPFKRGHYDEQLLALERRARGIHLDTTAIKPRMSIPKEFMLSPMGHPEKFVRTVGLSVFVQSRNDTKIEFYDFFRDAKFSLWWLPEVNNMCRLRPTSTAGVGQDGGMNFNFALHRTVNVSEVNLSPGTMPESANIIAVASPIFQGAFRFEAAHFPGHYLAFKPPTHMRMVGGIVDEKTAIDFKLVDYSQMFKYITAEEVLIPAVSGLGGQTEYVALSSVRGDSNVLLYFQNVLKKAVWADDDFETFFSSRSAEWDYDARSLRVRLRSKHEQLANSLRRSRNTAEVAASISAAHELDACRLPLDTLEAVLAALGAPLPPNADVSYVVNILDAQKKVLLALPKACEKDVSFMRLLSVCERVAAFGGENPDSKVARWRADAAKEFGDLVADHIRNNGVQEDVTLPLLAKIFRMPLPWRRCSDRMTKLAMPLLEGEPLEILLPFLRATVQALPASAGIAERLAGHARSLLKRADPAVVAEALDAMVTGGLCLESAPRDLERVLHGAPFAAVAGVVAGLGERGREGEDLRACAAFLGGERASLEALPPPLLLRLTVASTKSADVAGEALDAVAAAAAMSLPGWSMEDAAKLLLAVAKAKGGTESDGVASLYTRASEVLCQKLKEFSSVQLIKVVLAISKVPACWPLLVAAALEVASTRRLAEIPSAQLLLLTQGLLPLGAGHAALNLVLDYWAANFNQASNAEDLLTESIGAQMVHERRLELEGKGQLAADQLAKLAQTLASAAVGHDRFWKALALRFLGQGAAEGVADDLTAAGKAALQAAFPEGAGPKFEGKSKFLHVALGHKLPKEERERLKQKDKERELEKEKEREAARGEREKEREREREREKDRERGKGRDKERANGREREQDRDNHGKDHQDNERARDKDRGRGREGAAKADRQQAGREVSACDPKGTTKLQKQKRKPQEALADRGLVSSSGSSSSSSGSSSESSAADGKGQGGQNAPPPARNGEHLTKRRKSEAEGGAAGATARAIQKDTAKCRTKEKHPKIEISGHDQKEGAKGKQKRDEVEKEKRRLQRERRAKLKEEERQRCAAQDEDKKRLQKEHIEKLRVEQKEFEEKKQQDVEAEAEKRRLQRERRKSRAPQATVVELDD